MDQFSRVIFHVKLMDTDAFFLRFFDQKISVSPDRGIKLGDLVAFGKIRIEIVFPVEAALPRHFTV